MTLVLSLLLALVPLLGVLWIAVYGSLTTVDGLFMSLILLAMSGILVLNALLELKNKMYPSASGSTGAARGGGGTKTVQGLVQKGRVASVQFFEAHVGQPNKSIVMLESAPNASHMVVVEGDVRNALPVGQRVEMTLRKDGGSNVLVNVNYA
jgi:hypothetical protein